MSSKTVTLRSDQLAPQDIEAEQATLGAILVNPTCLDEVLQRISPDDFFIIRNGWILDAALSLKERGIDIDYLTISHELDVAGRLAECGGQSYLLELVNRTPSSLNAGGYAQLVAEMAYRRRLIDAGQTIASLAHSDDTGLTQIHEQVGALLNHLSGKMIRTYQPAGTLFGEFLDDLMQRVRDAENDRPHLGLTTGLPEWDHIFDGDFMPGTYSVVFGPTGIGKSWALVQMALAAAQQVPVVYVTLENLEERIRERMVAVTSGVPFTFIRYGMVNGKPMGSEMMTLCMQTASDLSHLPLEVVGHINSAQEIGDHLKAATIRHGRPGICFVDTLNELADSQRRDTRYENLTKASALMLRTMRQTGWGIIAAAQQRLELTAGMKWKAAKNAAYPTKHSLEGARTIVQHVANLIGIYSPDYVAREIHNDDYEDFECPRGQVLFVKVKGRETRPDMDGLVLWNSGIPRFESKGNVVKVDLPDYIGSHAQVSCPEDDLIDMER
jgi:replicative DNA helicase